MGAHGIVPPLKGVDLPQSHASADPNPPSRTANRATTSIDARLQQAAPIESAPPPACEGEGDKGTEGPGEGARAGAEEAPGGRGGRGGRSTQHRQ